MLLMATILGIEILLTHQFMMSEDVYERVMDPLVMDIMGGKAAQLAAMEPTCFGKYIQCSDLQGSQVPSEKFWSCWRSLKRT